MPALLLCFPVLRLQGLLEWGTLKSSWLRLPGCAGAPELLCPTARAGPRGSGSGRTLVLLGCSGLCSCQGSLASSRTAQCGRVWGETAQLVIQKRCSDTKSKGVTPKMLPRCAVLVPGHRHGQRQCGDRAGEEQGANPSLGQRMDRSMD